MPYILPVLRLDNHRSVSTGLDPVDAENSFGATIRNTFVCEVVVENGRVSVTDLAVV